jgi:hypothetical protein
VTDLPKSGFADRLLRITILDAEGNASVDTIALNLHEVGVEVNVSDLAMDVQEKLAVLMMRSYDPPTELLEGVGRRIDKNVFWVFVEH